MEFLRDLFGTSEEEEEEEEELILDSNTLNFYTKENIHDDYSLGDYFNLDFDRRKNNGKGCKKEKRKKKPKTREKAKNGKRKGKNMVKKKKIIEISPPTKIERLNIFNSSDEEYEEKDFHENNKYNPLGDEKRKKRQRYRVSSDDGQIMFCEGVRCNEKVSDLEYLNFECREVMQMVKRMRLETIEFDETKQKSFLKVLKNFKACWKDGDVIKAIKFEESICKVLEFDLLEEKFKMKEKKFENREIIRYFQKKCYTFPMNSNFFHYNGTRKIIISNKENEMKLFKIKPVFSSRKQFNNVVGFSLSKIGGFLFVFGGRYVKHKDKKVTNQFFVMHEGEIAAPDPKTPSISLKFFIQKSYSSKNVFRSMIIETTSPSPRYNHSCCSKKKSFFIFGGIDKNGNFINELWEFNFPMGSYDSSLPKMWVQYELNQKIHHGLEMPGLSGCAMFAIKKTLFVHGGKHKDLMNNQETIDHYLYKFDLLKKEWKCISLVNGKNEKIQLEGHSVIIQPHLGWIYVIGGVTDKKGTKSSRILRIFANFEEVKEDEMCNVVSYPFELSKIRKTEENVNDTIIKCINGEVNCSKGLLVSHSNFFRVLFEKNAEKNIIHFDGKEKRLCFDAQLIETYIDFLYSGNVILEGHRNIKEFIRVCFLIGKLEIVLKIINFPSLRVCQEIREEICDSYVKLLDSNSKLLSDITVKIERGKLFEKYCNKIFLCQSKTLRKMMTIGMSESVSGEIIFQFLSVNGINAVLDFFYSASTHKCNYSNAIEIYLFSTVFQIPLLCDVCEKIIISLINKESVIHLLGLFLVYRNDKLINECNTFLLEKKGLLESLNIEEYEDPNIINHLKLLKSSKKITELRKKQKLDYKENRKMSEVTLEEKLTKKNEVIMNYHNIDYFKKQKQFILDSEKKNYQRQKQKTERKTKYYFHEQKYFFHGKRYCWD